MPVLVQEDEAPRRLRQQRRGARFQSVDRRVRAEYAEAKRDGTAETFRTVLREQPLRVVLTILAIACLLGLVALPVLLLRG